MGKVIVPLYCGRCSRGEDAKPLDYIPARLTPSVSAEQRGQRESAAVLHPGLFGAATDLLWSGELTGDLAAIWERFCDGKSERKIAREMSLKTSQVRELLAPLKLKCGFSVKQS